MKITRNTDNSRMTGSSSSLLLLFIVIRSIQTQVKLEDGCIKYNVDTTITCILPSGKSVDPNVIFWTFNSAHIVSNGFVTGNITKYDTASTGTTFSLIIHNLAISDIGSYTCEQLYDLVLDLNLMKKDIEDITCNAAGDTKEIMISIEYNNKVVQNPVAEVDGKIVSCVDVSTSAEEPTAGTCTFNNVAAGIYSYTVNNYGDCNLMCTGQVTVTAVAADSELRYVREGYNVTFTCTTTVSGALNWQHITTGGITSVVAINEVVIDAFKDKFSVTIPTAGTYRLTLFFFNSKTDLGSYRCFTANFAIDNSFNIILAEGPSTASVNGISPVFADGTNYLTLTCTHDTATPNAIYMWWINGADITGGGTSTLTLSPVQASHNGANITCTAMNSVFNDIQASNSVILNVYYGAKDTSIEVSKNTSEGDDVTVICSCHSNPDPTFTITGPTPRLTISSSRLEIRNISRFDGGEYSCTAGNKYFTETKTTTVTVKYPPDVSVTYGNTTEADTGATFTCSAAGIPHSYNFYPWKHIAPDGKTIIRELRGYHIEGQYSLTFRESVSYEDSGYYRCTVHNGITGLSPHLNQTEISGYFVVEGPPKILEKEDSIHGDIGDEINIEMQLYAVPEYTSVKWYILNGNHMTYTQNSNTIQATLETTFHGQSVDVPGYITTLKLGSITANDFLSYRVVVNNTQGSSGFVKTLKGIMTATADEEKITPLGGIIGGVAGGSVVILICIIVVVLFMRSRRMSIKGTMLPCLGKEKMEPQNVYQNDAFDVDNSHGSMNDTDYQQLGPNENPRLHYEELSNMNGIPERNEEYERIRETAGESQYKQLHANTKRLEKTVPLHDGDDVEYVNTKLNC